MNPIFLPHQAYETIDSSGTASISKPGTTAAGKTGENPWPPAPTTSTPNQIYPPLSSSLPSAGQVLGTSLGASLGLPQVAETGPDGVFQYPHTRMNKDFWSIVLAF